MNVFVCATSPTSANCCKKNINKIVNLLPMVQRAKMDEDLLLGQAILCMIHLHERVMALEQAAMEQTVVAGNSLVEMEEDSSDEGRGDFDLPDIELKVSDMNMLLRVLCEKRKGVLVKMIEELEKHNMTVVSTSAARFGSFLLDITIVAEMEEELRYPIEELVEDLRSACLE